MSGFTTHDHVKSAHAHTCKCIRASHALDVQAALRLACASPASAARVFAGRDSLGAWRTPDGWIAVVDQQIDEHPVVGDVTVYVRLGPCRERAHLDLVSLCVPTDHRRVGAVRSLVAADAAGPCGVRRETTVEYFYLSHRAA